MNELEKIRTFTYILHSEIVELNDTYELLSFLKSNIAKKFVEKAELKHTRKALVINLLTNLLLNLCKIYEKPGKNNKSNVNIYSYLHLINKNSVLLEKNSVSGVIRKEYNITEEKIKSDLEKIDSFKDEMQSLFAYRNKLLGHADYDYLMSPEKSSKDLKVLSSRIVEIVDTTKEIFEFYLSSILGEEIPKSGISYEIKKHLI